MSGPLGFGAGGGGGDAVREVIAGSGITTSGTATSITVVNDGVRSLSGSGISVSSATGAVTITAPTVSGGTGISVSGSGTTALTVSATGVNSVTAGTGISVSGTTALTVSATGVQSLTAGTGISVSGTTTPTVTNSGVTSIVAGTNVTVSGATGAVTINAPGFATPGASAVGDTAADGSATTVARSDHRHSREAFGTPVALSGALAAGSATTVARSDHQHGLNSSGARTANYTSLTVSVTDTSSTSSVTKTGMLVSSTGTWNGATAVNEALHLTATGGTTNFGLVSDQRIKVGGITINDSSGTSGVISIGQGANSTYTSGSVGIFIGKNAGAGNSTSDGLIAIGTDALKVANTVANSYNMGIGQESGKAITTGINNVSVGGFTNSSVTTGSGNTAVGNAALNASTGSNNSAFGMNAYLTGSYSNSTCLGYNTAVTGSNQVQLGDSATTTYVYGTVQNRSDARDKADVRDTVLGLEWVKRLRPVDYRWDMRDDYRPINERPAPLIDDVSDEQKAAHQAAVAAWQASCELAAQTPDGTHKRTRYHHGFLAQDVAQVISATGTDFGGYQDHTIAGGEDVLSLGYDEFVAPLVKAVQELSALVDRMQARIQALEASR